MSRNLVVLVKGVAMDKEYIKQKLRTDYNSVCKALLILYQYQTADEQRTRGTHHQNQMGFNSSDAKALSKYAQWVQKGLELGFMELNDARRRLPKYAGQILQYYAARHGQ